MSIREPTLRRFLEGSMEQNPIFSSPEDLFDREKIEQAVAQAAAKIKGKIPELMPMLPPQYKDAVMLIVREEGGGEDLDDAYKIMAEWIVQRQFLLEIEILMGLKSVDLFNGQSPDGFIALTRGGSILTGTSPHSADRHGGLLRKMEYIRIAWRKKHWKGDNTFSDHQLSFLQTTLPGMVFDEAMRNVLSTSQIDSILVIPQSRASEVENITRAVRVGFRALMPPPDEPTQ